MKKLTLLLSIFSLLIAFGCQSSQNGTDGKVMAKVNVQELTEEQINAELSLAYGDNIPAQARKDYLNRWIENQLFYEEAKRRGLEKNPEVKERIEQAGKDVMVISLLQGQITKQIQVSEDEARKFYEQNQALFKRDQDEVRASHILFPTREQAGSAYARLKKGEDFKKLAQELSLDSQTKNSGGDIGYFSLSNMHPLIAGAAFNLKVGAFSSPFQTEIGYHILKVTDRKPKGSIREFEEVKDKLIAQMTAEKKNEVVTQLLDELKKKAKIERFGWAKDTLAIK